MEGGLLDEAHGSEVAPHALSDGGGRVGVRAQELSPLAAGRAPSHERQLGQHLFEFPKVRH